MYLCVVRGQKYFVKSAGKKGSREAALGKDHSLPLGVQPDGSRTQNFTQKTD